MTNASRRARWAVGAILGSIVALDVTSMRHVSVTYDEPRHFQYGRQLLAGDASRFDDSKMPFSALNALPAVLGERVAPGPVADALTRLETGRYVTALFSLFLALGVYRWASELYGAAAGLLALGLHALEPNLLAHSQLVTTDLYAAGMITWALYTFWRLLRDGGRRWALVCGTTLALAQLAKYTAVFLFPLFVVIALGFHARALSQEIKARDATALRRRALSGLRFALLAVALSVLVINLGFLFDRTLTPLSGYAFRSQMFQRIQASATILGRVPIPVPYPYLEGLDWVAQRERTGEGYGALYLRGELRKASGFPGYYLFATLYKVPIPTLAIWALGLASLFAARPARLADEWVLAGPLLFFTVYFNFFFRAQIGLRFFLVAFPLLSILAGRLLRAWPAVPRIARTALAVAAVYLVISVGSYFPHYIPYFNELVGNRRLAYRLLADSNLDWRQHLWYLERYLRAHPDAIIEPERATAGTIIVGANSLTGVAGDAERFRWLREHFTPVDDIAYSTLVYRVTVDDLRRLGLAAPATGGR